MSETLQDVVLAALRNRYLTLPTDGLERLADEITQAVLRRLHDTGALSVPPEDIACPQFPMTAPENETP